MTNRPLVVTVGNRFAATVRQWMRRFPSGRVALQNLAAAPVTSAPSLTKGAGRLAHGKTLPPGQNPRAKARPRAPSLSGDVFVISDLGDARDVRPEIAGASGVAGGATIRYLLFKGDDVSLDALGDRVPRLGIRAANRLHIADASRAEEILRRMVHGLAEPAADRIVHAWCEGENFVVLSPAFARIVLAKSALAAAFRGEASRIADFEIDPDGSFVYWPHADAHLGWQQFRQLADPQAAAAARVKGVAFDRRYGAAIRRVREQSGLLQSAIAGLSARQVRRIENGQSRATLKSLQRLAAAHKLSINEYLDRIAEAVG